MARRVGRAGVARSRDEFRNLREAILRARPVAFWPMTDTSGNFADIVGGYTATKTGGTVTYGVTGIDASAPADTCIDFAGGYGVASLAFPDNDAPWSVECLGSFDGANNDVIWMAGIDGQAHIFSYFVNSNTYLSMVVNPEGFVGTSRPNSYFIGTGTHHMVWTFDGTTIKTYIDGVQAGSSNLAGASPNIATDTFTIGAYSTGTELMDGRLSKLAVYNYALTAPVIKAHAALGLHGIPSPSTRGSGGVMTFGPGTHTFVVPSDVTALTVDMAGAEGSTNTYGNGVAGLGVRMTGTIAVTPGESLVLAVGGTPRTGYRWGGGYNGGGNGGIQSYNTAYAGGGGGGTDIRRGGSALTDRIAVAGGGGGSSWTLVGGDGGLTGSAGGTDSGNGGGGGTGSAGGAAGANGAGSPTAGTLGVGGNGGSAVGNQQGGAGGGGYYGGGGGGANGQSGGGGGSSLVATGLAIVGTKSGDGNMILSWA